MNGNYFIQTSKIYSLLKKYVSFTYHIFYDTVSIDGLENIPDNVPVIFTPNHQNALMDAFAIIVHTKKQPVFMAKADIFQAKVLAKLLNTLKIIPVYRIRDGYENLGNNDQSFQIAQRCLFTSNNVGIMPEGTQTDKQQLQPLKKGFARLAFSAQELIGEKPGIVVVPVGIHYSNYYNFRSNVHISFGKPIEVNEYFALYKENPQKAFADIKDRLFVELKKQMVSIDNNEHYNLIRNIKDIVSGELVKQSGNEITYANQVKLEKQISECLSDAFAKDAELVVEMDKYVNEYINTLKRLNLANEVFENKYPQEHLIIDVIRFVFFFPFVAAGALFNIIPAIISSIISQKTEDSQFISSIKFGLGIVIFPLYYLLFLVMPIPVITKLLLIVTMPLLGILAFDYFKGLRIFWSSIRFHNGLNRNDTELSRWVYTRSQIIKKVKACLGNQ
jgi:1-acyl-sn-glycerol-3-phosphate acyltransferase